MFSFSVELTSDEFFRFFWCVTVNIFFIYCSFHRKLPWIDLISYAWVVSYTNCIVDTIWWLCLFLEVFFLIWFCSLNKYILCSLFSLCFCYYSFCSALVQWIHIFWSKEVFVNLFWKFWLYFPKSIFSLFCSLKIILPFVCVRVSVCWNAMKSVTVVAIIVVTSSLLLMTVVFLFDLCRIHAHYHCRRWFPNHCIVFLNVFTAFWLFLK